MVAAPPVEEHSTVSEIMHEELEAPGEIFSIWIFMFIFIHETWYSQSVMCKVGLPVLPVFQLHAPLQPSSTTEIFLSRKKKGETLSNLLEKL